MFYGMYYYYIITIEPPIHDGADESKVIGCCSLFSVILSAHILNKIIIILLHYFPKV